MTLTAVGVGTRALAGWSSPSAVEKPRSEEEVTEYQIKAAFLLNIIKFITWPKDALGPPDKPIVVMVVGKNPFGKTLEKFLSEKRAHGRRFAVKHYAAPPKELDAHVVFMKGLEEADRKKLIEQCEKSSTLLVGDKEGLAATGVSVGFFIEKRRVRFEVNVNALKRSKLTASSELLKLARIVKEKTSAEIPWSESHGPDSPKNEPSPDGQLPTSSPPPPTLEPPNSGTAPQLPVSGPTMDE